MKPSACRSSVRFDYALLTAGVICGLSGCAKSTPEPIKAASPRVTVVSPERREVVDYHDYNGWMTPSQTVEIRSRVRGHIHKIHFTDGQIVEQDQLLFELDPRPFEADIEVAQGQVAVAQAQLEFAIAEEQREQELFEKKINTKADLQKAVASRKTWEANVAAAMQEVTRKQLDLTYSKITAPLRGKISRAMLDAGNLVNAGGSDPLLTTIVAMDPLYIYFYVDERTVLEYRAANAVRTAQQNSQPLKDSQLPFQFGLETDIGFPHQGTLDFSENKIDSTTGTFELRGVVQNADLNFLPGSRVRVRVPVKEPSTAVLVPDVAILSDQDQRYVLCLNAENLVVRKTLLLGRLLDDGQRVVLGGRTESDTLTTDDLVIVQGLQRARINYPVEPYDTHGEPVSRSPQKTPPAD